MPQRSLMGVLILLVLFSPLGVDIYLPSFNTIIEYFNTTADKVQYTLSLFILSMGIGQLAAGPLTDRFGRRPVAMAGIVMYMISSLLIILCQTIDQLIILRMLQGASACCTTTVAFAVVRDRLPPREAAQAYSYLNGALNIAPALAPSLGGALAAAFSWQANFVFLALFALVGLVLVTVKLPETRPDQTSQRPFRLMASYRELLGHRAFVLNSLCCMGAMAVILSYVSFAPQVLISTMGISTTEFALLFGANALVIMAGSFAAGRSMFLLGESGCMIIGSLMMLTGATLMAGGCWLDLRTAWSFMVPVMIACCGFAWLLGAATSRALADFPHIAGTASALLVCIQMLGAALVSILAQATPIGHRLMLAILMLAMAVFACLVTVMSKEPKSTTGHVEPVTG